MNRLNRKRIKEILQDAVDKVDNCSINYVTAVSLNILHAAKGGFNGTPEDVAVGSLAYERFHSKADFNTFLAAETIAPSLVLVTDTTPFAYTDTNGIETIGMTWWLGMISKTSEQALDSDTLFTSESESSNEIPNSPDNVQSKITTNNVNIKTGGNTYMYNEERTVELTLGSLKYKVITRGNWLSIYATLPDKGDVFIGRTDEVDCTNNLFVVPSIDYIRKTYKPSHIEIFEILLKEYASFRQKEINIFIEKRDKELEKEGDKLMELIKAGGKSDKIPALGLSSYEYSYNFIQNKT